MADIEITSAHFKQPIDCKCGKPLSPRDIRAVSNRVEIICSACHSTVCEIEIEGGSGKWD